jgi:hypothetical protein
MQVFKEISESIKAHVMPPFSYMFEKQMKFKQYAELRVINSDEMGYLLSNT